MSDMSIHLICGTVILLGFLSLAAFVAWIYR